MEMAKSIFTLILAGLMVAGAFNRVCAQEVTVRASVDSTGAQSDGSSTYATVSAGGRYIAFESMARNLVSADTNNTSDIFVHDLYTGVTERVSVTSAGGEADKGSYYASISGDGRYVAFNSHAYYLVPGDTNYVSDIFVHDRSTRETFRVSVSSAGAEANNGSSGASISENGRYVAFSSSATNLVSGDTNYVSDIFVHDIVTGATERVSLSSAGAEANASSSYPSTSGDGRYVAFFSSASNLVSDDGNGKIDIFVHDRVTGATVRASVDSSGTEGDGASQFPSISSDGRWVAFHSEAQNLVPGDTNGWTDVFVHDLQTGATVRASVDSAGAQANSLSTEPSISGDGRRVTFLSSASNLVSGDGNSCADIFVHDLQTGETWLASVDSSGALGNMSCGYSPTLSPDGAFVVFSSSASNLAPGDTNGAADIFLRGRLYLSVDTPYLSLGGTVVNFSLQAGAANAGRTYLLLGSVTGTVPGTALPGGLAVLPLNWDLFTDTVLYLLNTPIFSGFLGVLDGAGSAAAQLNPGPLPPEYEGVILRFAYC